ncbi:hypothetical protein EJ07DRAFT_152635 [Lizonia empirigonia]|nr:hypothetical protein EJ07DRAFT_152635 [Lizonia empirigonia]
MSIPIRYQIQTPTRAETQPPATKGSEVKPRKVNSEMRKQQNRIASRNYRMSSQQATLYLIKHSHSLIAGEKRKHKLQQLRKLLEDGDSNEQQIYTKSASLYNDQSYSGSVEHESSASPYFAVLSDDSPSPTSENTIISAQGWTVAVTVSSEQSFLEAQSTFDLPQGPTTYDTNGPASHLLWNEPAYTASTNHSDSSSFRYPTYPTTPSSWTQLEPNNMYPHTGVRQETVLNTYSYPPSQSYSQSRDSQDKNILHSYGRTHHPYEPC